MQSDVRPPHPKRRYNKGMSSDVPSCITVEFYGIPRQRAGVPSLALESMPEGASLADALAQLAVRLPALAEVCFPEGGLKRGYVANLNGDRFVADPATQLAPGDCLLIMSADAGG